MKRALILLVCLALVGLPFLGLAVAHRTSSEARATTSGIPSKTMDSRTVLLAPILMDPASRETAFEAGEPWVEVQSTHQEGRLVLVFSSGFPDLLLEMPAERAFVISRAIPSHDDEVSIPSDIQPSWQRALEARPEPGQYLLRIRADVLPIDAEAEAPNTPESAAPWNYYLLVVTAQHSMSLFALAPYSGLAPQSANPAGLAFVRPFGRSGSKVEIASAEVLPTSTPGWLLMATYALLLTAVGLAAWRIWSLAPGSLSLFTRFERDEVLEHRRRNRLFECVQARPGVSFGELRAATDFSPGVLQHHLRLLEQHGLVRRQRSGRHTRFYPRGPRIETATSLSPARSRLLEILNAEHRLTATQLAERLGQRVQSTWEVLKNLHAAGLIQGERKGRATAWRLAAAG